MDIKAAVYRRKGRFQSLDALRKDGEIVSCFAPAAAPPSILWRSIAELAGTICGEDAEGAGTAREG